MLKDLLLYIIKPHVLMLSSTWRIANEQSTMWNIAKMKRPSPQQDLTASSICQLLAYIDVFVELAWDDLESCKVRGETILEAIDYDQEDHRQVLKTWSSINCCNHFFLMSFFSHWVFLCKVLMRQQVWRKLMHAMYSFLIPFFSHWVFRVSF
jgi:hypothetical protein